MVQALDKIGWHNDLKFPFEDGQDVFFQQSRKALGIHFFVHSEPQRCQVFEHGAHGQYFRIDNGAVIVEEDMPDQS